MMVAMKSTVIAAAVAGGLAATAVQAAEGPASDGVTVYGLIDAGAGSGKGAGGKSTLEMFDGGLDTPFFGFKAAQDLGQFGEARVILEGFFNSKTGASGRPAPGGDVLFGREAAVEWSGSAGAIKMGRIDAPALHPILDFNPLRGGPTLSPMFTHMFIAGIAGPGPNNETAGLLGANTFTDTQWDNAIKLSVPKSLGVDASVFYEFGGKAGDTGKHNIGANFIYNAGPFSVGGFIEDNWVCNPIGCLTVTINPATTPATVTTSAGSTNILAAEEKTWFLGVTYDFGVAKLYAGYDHYTLGAASQPALSFEAGNFGSSSKLPEAAVKVPVGNANVILAWAATSTTLASGANVRWGTTSLVYDYNFSKRTDGYIGAMQETLTSYSSGDLVMLGLKHRF